MPSTCVIRSVVKESSQLLRGWRKRDRLPLLQMFQAGDLVDVVCGCILTFICTWWLLLRRFFIISFCNRKLRTTSAWRNWCLFRLVLCECSFRWGWRDCGYISSILHFLTAHCARTILKISNTAVPSCINSLSSVSIKQFFEDWRYRDICRFDFKKRQVRCKQPGKRICASPWERARCLDYSAQHFCIFTPSW